MGVVWRTIRSVSLDSPDVPGKDMSMSISEVGNGLLGRARLPNECFVRI